MITGVKEFLSLCHNTSRAYHSESYLSTSMQRQYQLFRSIEARMLRDGSISPSLVSIGAGGAFVEQALVRKYQFAITVLDFPEMIERNRGLYDACGFSCIGADLGGGLWPGLPPVSFVLSADNIEHVKISAAEYLANCRRLCQDRGELVISTDNQGSLKTIGRLIMGKRITPDLASVLSEGCFENEGIHRKEFNWRELCELVNSSGFMVRKHRFYWQSCRRARKSLGRFGLEVLLPTLRPHQQINAVAISSN